MLEADPRQKNLGVGIEQVTVAIYRWCYSIRITDRRYSILCIYRMYKLKVRVKCRLPTSVVELTLPANAGHRYTCTPIHNIGRVATQEPRVLALSPTE